MRTEKIVTVAIYLVALATAFVLGVSGTIVVGLSLVPKKTPSSYSVPTSGQQPVKVPHAPAKPLSAEC